MCHPPLASASRAPAGVPGAVVLIALPVSPLIAHSSGLAAVARPMNVTPPSPGTGRAPAKVPGAVAPMALPSTPPVANGGGPAAVACSMNAVLSLIDTN